MLIDLFPPAHVRYTCLALLGTQLDGLARWLEARGFPAEAIRERIRKAPALEALRLPLGKGGLGQLSREQLLALAPRPARDSAYLPALVRSLPAYLDELGLLDRLSPRRAHVSSAPISNFSVKCAESPPPPSATTATPRGSSSPSCASTTSRLRCRRWPRPGSRPSCRRSPHAAAKETFNIRHRHGL